jgi:predicted MFS family arabinose efflux permease
MVYVSIGLLLPFGVSGMGTIAASNLVSRWFTAGLSSAMGLLAAALGTGILLFAPLSQALIEQLGWRMAYAALAGLLAAIWLLQFGLPWQNMRAEAGSKVTQIPVEQSKRLSLAAIMRLASHQRLFWALFGIMFVTSVSTYAVTVQLVAYLVSAGLEPLHAAWVFGATGLASIGGMLAAGHLARRWGEVRVARISYTATVLGLIALALFQYGASIGFLIAYVLLFGTMQGSRGPLVAVLAARGFAGAHQSTMYGFVLIGMGFGGALGSWASAVLFDWLESYNPMMILSALAALAGYLIFWRMNAWNKA